MATKLGLARSSEGCWTCRLRRKKCDEARPVCQGCASLEIDCVYGEGKPEWMDNEEHRKIKADEVKAEIKRKAAWRRERRHLQSIENGGSDVDMAMGSDGEPATSASASNAAATSSSSAARMTPASSSGASHTPSTPGHEAEGWSPLRANLNPPNLQSEQEMIMTMVYLDYVFPFLFPLYRAPIATAGRGWLLVLLLNNKPLFHSALSMTNYFYSVLHAAHGELEAIGTSECLEHGWRGLQQQQAMSLQALQGEVRDVMAQGVAADLPRSARLVEAVVQVLCFDAALAGASGGDWTAHLGAAATVLAQLLESGRDADPADPDPPGPAPPGPWTRLLSRLGPGRQDVSRPSPVQSEQAALRFYASVLLHIDIVASTGGDAPPRLEPYHALLLPAPAPDADPAPAGAAYPLLELEEVVGVETWCLQAVARIGALARWKRAARAAGTLSVPELFARAAVLETELRTRVACLAAFGARSAPAAHAIAVAQVHARAAGPHSRCPPALFEKPPLDVAAATRPWALAALAWVLAVANGWSMRNPAIRAAVLDAVGAMGTLPNPACLRAVAWPLAVTGCLAGPDMEAPFRDMVAAIAGRLEVFGCVREALALAEGVWARRAEVEADEQAWDLARCFEALGRTPFLM